MDQAVRDLKEMNIMGLRPGNFKGTSEPEKFFKKFERLASYGEWDKVKMGKVVPLLFDGKASDFFDSLDDQKKEDYDELKTAVIQHFQCNKSKLVRWTELNQKVLVLDQSVADFHDELVEDARKLGGVSDEQLMICFVNGLPNDLREYVALAEPTTLAESLNKARLYESLKAARTKIRFSVAGTEFAEERLWQERQKLINEETTQRLAELTTAMKELLNNQRRAYGSNNVHAHPRKFSQDRTPRKINPSNITPKEERSCFHCGLKGHLKQQCYIRQQGQNRIAGRQTNTATETTSRCPANMKLKGVLNGNTAECLVDTGSQVTICGKEFWDTWHTHPEVQQPGCTSIISVSGDTSNVVGSFEGEIVIGDFKATYTFQVVEKARYQVILGEDFLEVYAKRMIWPTRTIVWREEPKWVSSMNKGNGDVCNGRLKKGLRLQPRTSRRVKIYPDGNTFCTRVKVEGTENILGLQTRPAILAGYTETMEVTVVNQTSTTIELRKGKIVARMYEMDEEGRVNGLESDQPEERTCFRCGKKGHIRWQCYKYLRRHGKRGAGGRPGINKFEASSKCPPIRDNCNGRLLEGKQKKGHLKRWCHLRQRDRGAGRFAGGKMGHKKRNCWNREKPADGNKTQNGRGDEALKQQLLPGCICGDILNCRHYMLQGGLEATVPAAECIDSCKEPDTYLQKCYEAAKAEAKERSRVDYGKMEKVIGEFQNCFGKPCMGVERLDIQSRIEGNRRQKANRETPVNDVKKLSPWAKVDAGLHNDRNVLAVRNPIDLPSSVRYKARVCKANVERAFVSRYQGQEDEGKTGSFTHPHKMEQDRGAHISSPRGLPFSWW